MDVMALYKRLPEDLCACIRSYFHVWERFGLIEPAVRQTLPSAYYSLVRRSPRGFRWDRTYPDFFYFRRQRDAFQWRLMLTPAHQQMDDIWSTFWYVCMTPQWESTDVLHDRVHMLWRDRFYTTIPYPHDATLIDSYVLGASELVILFVVTRPMATSPPTTQACVYAFAEYIKGLADVVKNFPQKKKDTAKT
jgi:hypothetical protein